ncbi:uncharacterized protein LOC116427347 [Nomia melanderi]|uniref:uncharacterized protein LOC116427347 n=1 Tax=Nomia melanderi TaxID=2448451 RepID=UPI003FCD372E
MLAELHLLISATLTVHGSRDFFRPADVVGAEAVVACANEAARSLFNPERRIDVIDLDAGDLGNAIARTLTRDSGIFVANRWRPVKNERIPGFVVIEHGGFPSSRRMLMPGEPALRTLQFLFVTRSGVDAVRSFAGDLRDASYRDVAFLVFDEAAATGTVVRANSTGKEITLRSVGSCGPSGTDAHRIPAFTADARRYCPSGGCSVKYGMVADQTVRFWRKEDTLKLKRKDNLRAVGALLVEHFGDYYNVSVDSSAGNSMPWADAIARLISRDIDVVIGPRLSDLATLVDMEIVCWYMYRNMLFAGLVRFRAIRNDILLLLTPFHYFIWICVVVLLVAYILLLIALRRLFAAGLIKERVKFEYVCSIMLGQGVTFPGNSGLRLVMLLWMVFSLYLSITYNSTFTSSLAEVETEDLLKNLKQVRDSGQPLGGPAVILSYFNDSSDRAVQQLYYR